jgi:hypothetical protein
MKNFTVKHFPAENSKEEKNKSIMMTTLIAEDDIDSEDSIDTKDQQPWTDGWISDGRVSFFLA